MTEYERISLKLLLYIAAQVAMATTPLLDDDSLQENQGILQSLSDVVQQAVSE